MFSIAKIYFIVFGFLTVAGGIMGYVKAGSTISLVAGSVAGILLLAGGFMLTASSQPILLGLGLVSLVLAIKFVPDVIKKQEMMPAGLMAVLSVVGLVMAAWTYFGSAK